jgi:PiT family inorganic phosphate transporter
LAGLLAAIAWNLLTWFFGIPSSSSHTLIGGFIGAAVARYGTFAVIASEKVLPIVLFIFGAPLIGMIMAFIINNIIVNLFKNSRPYKAERWFRRLQLLSSAAFSLGHGGNDAQKVMGIIGAAMVASNYIEGLNDIPTWVPISCFIAIAIGTMSGGWRIVKTMGTRITKVTPLEGVSAETAGAITLYLTEHLGIPVSTTHTISGSIMGAGATKRLSAVRWGITISLLWAWILTIPVSALMGGTIYFIFRLLGF